MREGFTNEAFNSRGVHIVDPTGSPEDDISEKWEKRAEAVELRGYPRFATELRKFAGNYRIQAERIRKNPHFE